MMLPGATTGLLIAGMLAPLPDRHGFAGAFAGVSGGALLVAGGANFPDKKPWEGGRKVWYDTVFVLEQPNGKWKAAGKLSRPLGYGVCVTHGGAVVCVGGSDAVRHYGDAFRLEWKGGKLVSTELPSLPKPLANACGAMVGDWLYVAGGQERPDSSHALRTVYRIALNRAKPDWQRIDDAPGAERMLAVAAGFDGAFWLLGGVELVAGNSGRVERKYLRDAWRFEPGKGWKRLADLPHALAAAPAPAPADATGFYVLGGDDGTQVGAAPDRHRGFSRRILRYDAQADRWSDAGELPAPRVTAACVRWGDHWVVPSGEMRPGIRSPEVWTYSTGKPLR